MIDYALLIVWGILFLVVVIKFFQSIRLVSTQTAHIVERLGQYQKTLDAGFHALLPFIDKVTFVQDLREEAIDVPPQECFTGDEVQVTVDGVIYMSVTDPVKASYGITDYRFAAVQLAKTTTRSVIGTLDLDRTFEERDIISAKVVEVLDEAGSSWGIRVHRYEIKNISPPETVRSAMEKQVRAERDRRAILASSEGDKQSRINRSEGLKTEVINRSEGEMQRCINEAEGKAAEILAIAEASAESIEKLAAVFASNEGGDALKMQVKEKYIDTMKALASSKIILPANVASYDGWIANLGLEKAVEGNSTQEKD
ncbi:MAG: paraslipin [Gammaproteobacteria bacterium TMED1]|jgi:regulator of protease activity HflC (stomatin/prohibitin superfamily)|nr:MAG: paraslipin [Gammaproteobacteria bacterium TMED1]|tara:strand:+ start:1301 stop:2239 length:939 start_codon:yes stop_codon:yes gene_type:complete